MTKDERLAKISEDFEYAILVHILDNADTNRDRTVAAVAKELAEKHGESESDAITLGYLIYQELVDRKMIAQIPISREAV